MRGVLVAKYRIVVDSSLESFRHVSKVKLPQVLVAIAQPCPVLLNPSSSTPAGPARPSPAGPQVGSAPLAGQQSLANLTMPSSSA